MSYGPNAQSSSLLDTTPGGSFRSLVGEISVLQGQAHRIGVIDCGAIGVRGSRVAGLFVGEDGIPVPPFDVSAFQLIF